MSAESTILVIVLHLVLSSVSSSDKFSSLIFMIDLPQSIYLVHGRPLSRIPATSRQRAVLALPPLSLLWTQSYQLNLSCEILNCINATSSVKERLVFFCLSVLVRSMDHLSMFISVMCTSFRPSLIKPSTRFRTRQLGEKQSYKSH